jgi:hypothetical protein
LDFGDSLASDCIVSQAERSAGVTSALGYGGTALPHWPQDSTTDAAVLSVTSGNTAG